jgi:DsbC/DsbD-like thiol-disulfide interchange protein
MNKLFVSLVAVLAASSVVMAQGQGGGRGQGAGRGQGGGNQQGRAQSVSVPVSVLRGSGMLPLTAEKLDALEADLKVLQSVNLPAEAVVELKLTADQKKSLTELGKQSQEKAREAMQAGDREGVMAVREATTAKVDAVLTADQKKVVAKYPSRQGGGRGNRPGGPPPAK